MVADKEVDMVANMRVGHEGWFIGHKLFHLKLYPACASSKLYEFIGISQCSIIGFSFDMW